MNLSIEASKDGFLAFGQGVAFFAPTRAEAAAGAIKEMEKEPDDGKEYTDLTELVRELHGLLAFPDLRVNVMLNINLQPMGIMSSNEQIEEWQIRLKDRLQKASLGLSAVSGAVSDLLMGKKNIIILEKI